MAKTQERLATGLKVNSALDNPTNFFTASALNSRAGDMANLLDSMSSGIKTIEAADNGLKSITKTVETMQSTLRQARQDKSFKTGSYTVDTATIGTSTIKNLSFTGGAFGTSTVDFALNDTSAATAGVANLTFGAGGTLDTLATLDFTVTVDGAAQNISISQADVLAIGDADTAIDDAAEFRTLLASKVTGVTVGGTGSAISLTSNTTGATSDVDIGIATIGGTVGTSTLTAAAAGLNATINGTVGVAAGVSAGTVKTVDTMVTQINNNLALKDKIRASNDNGKLRIENLSTSDLSVIGVGPDGEIDGTTGASNTVAVGGNDVRKNLVKQFNELRDQLDKFADDASFNGINLLRGDKLKLTFNETGTSTIEIQAKDEGGVPTSINNTALGIDEVFTADFDNDTTLDDKLDTLADVMGKLRSHASSFGSNLSIVENRTDFTKNMINTLETGASNLTLADTNEEAANLLALQTRQQLSSTALSMASQADQAVLRLFG
jgi:flagellin-like hook-associated protein FlgL